MPLSIRLQQFLDLLSTDGLSTPDVPKLVRAMPPVVLSKDTMALNSVLDAVSRRPSIADVFFSIEMFSSLVTGQWPEGWQRAVDASKTLGAKVCKDMLLASRGTPFFDTAVRVLLEYCDECLSKNAQNPSAHEHWAHQASSVLEALSNAAVATNAPDLFEQCIKRARLVSTNPLPYNEDYNYSEAALLGLTWVFKKRLAAGPTTSSFSYYWKDLLGFASPSDLDELARHVARVSPALLPTLLATALNQKELWSRDLFSLCQTLMELDPSAPPPAMVRLMATAQTQGWADKDCAERFYATALPQCTADTNISSVFFEIVSDCTKTNNWESLRSMSRVSSTAYSDTLSKVVSRSASLPSSLAQLIDKVDDTTDRVLAASPASSPELIQLRQRLALVDATKNLGVPSRKKKVM